MLVKFEEEDKKTPKQLPGEIDVEELSTIIGKQEAEIEKQKYTPTPEDLEKLEAELIKLNEQKFGTLEGPIGTNGPDDSELNEVTNDEIKRLSYLRRDA
jgi:hypothetical protein